MAQAMHSEQISYESSAAAEADHAEAELARKIESSAKLDSIISGAQDAAEKQDEFEDFVAARAYRKELAERHGGSASDVIEAFSRYSHDLKTNGALAGEKLAGDYYANTNVGKMHHAIEKQRAELEQKTAKADKQDDVFPGVKLDRIIENALDETDERAKDQAEFERAKEIFAPIKAQNPHLNFQEFFKNTTVADRELCRDPAFAYRLVAATGTPVTPLQKVEAQIQTERQQETLAANSLLTEMSNNGELVDLDRHKPVMAQILQHPNFVQTNDLRMDIRRANRIAELLDVHRLQEFERQSGVEKAKRAAPVKVSGGIRTAASGRSDNLDSIIGNATSHIADDCVNAT